MYEPDASYPDHDAEKMEHSQFLQKISFQHESISSETDLL